MSEAVQRISVIKDTLLELLKAMDIAAEKVEVEEDGHGTFKVSVQVSEKIAPLLIGTYGQALAALQVVFKSLLWKKDLDEKSSVWIDINGYRQSQEDKMLELAEEKAEAVKATGMPQKMPPMSSFMRRKIHLYLADKEEFADIETESVGEGDMRRLQIRKKGTGSTDL